MESYAGVDGMLLPHVLAVYISLWMTPDSKVHGANMGSIRGRQDSGGPHVGPLNYAIWDIATTDSNALLSPDFN